MVDLNDSMNLIITILPFIFGIIAISLIPSKEKILNKQVKKYSVEVLVLVYIIAFLILVIGFYYFIALFSSTPNNQSMNFVNGIFLEIIALGIMGLNYRNHTIFYELIGESEFESRTPGPGQEDVYEVEPSGLIEKTKQTGKRSKLKLI